MLSLAARYRPITFQDIVGQDFTKQVIIKGLQSNRLSQVLLFSGGPGIGKTTFARLIATQLVCTSTSCSNSIHSSFPYSPISSHSPTSLTSYSTSPTSPTSHTSPHAPIPSTSHISPTSCPNCTLARSNSHPDILEFDAATNTGISDIKTALESAIYQPQLANRRIFIIDEIHMLSKSAISSLLKIIEDTPPNVWFIFATTELTKIPYTIISRSLVFNLTPISQQDTINRMQQICIKEHIQADESALQLIATSTNGCMRASLSLLEQIAIANNNHINYSTVIQATQILDPSLLLKLYQSIKQQDIQSIFAISKQIRDPYKTVLQLLQLAEHNHDMHLGLQMGYALEELAYSPEPNNLIACLLAKSSYISSLPTPNLLWSTIKQQSSSIPSTPPISPSPTSTTTTSPSPTSTTTTSSSPTSSSPTSPSTPTSTTTTSPSTPSTPTTPLSTPSTSPLSTSTTPLSTSPTSPSPTTPSTPSTPSTSPSTLSTSPSTLSTSPSTIPTSSSSIEQLIEYAKSLFNH